MLSRLFAKKFLGIDIGTTSVKMVELEDAGRGLSLANYGQIDPNLVENQESDIEERGRTMADFSAAEIAEMIRAIMAEAKIKTRQCALSIPDFLTFFTSFFLPPMTEKEIGAAVMFEARQHIPLPIDSVTVDWQLIGGAFGKPEKMEIAVTAMPNEIITKYKEIALKANLQMMLMEAEAFGLAKALISEDEVAAVCLIDIGLQSTVCNLVQNKILRYSHSFDRGADYLFSNLSRQMPIERETIAAAKKKYGFKIFSLMDPDVKEKMEKPFKEAFAPILQEIEMALADYRRNSGIDAAKIILSGGAAAAPEIKNQFENHFKKETLIADPFAKIAHSPEIAEEMKNIGPSYAAAVGMARRGFDLAKFAR